MYILDREITKKHILIALGILLVVILGIWALILAFRGAPEPPAPPGTQPPITGELPPGVPREGVLRPVTPITGVDIPPPPPSIPGGAVPPSTTAQGGKTEINRLTFTPVSHPKKTSGRDLAYYDNETGRFFRITPDGDTTPLSDRVFYNVENVAWAPKTDKAILEFPDGANILYDFNADTQATLPKQWEQFSFSPSGGSIAFKSLGERDEDRWLAVAAPDGSGARRIEHLGNNDRKVIVDWSPNQQVLALYPEGVGLNAQDVILLGQNGENFLSLPVEGRGFKSQWSPDGSHLLYSVYQIDGGFLPQLFIASAQGDAIGVVNQRLGIATWPDKCVFQNTTDVICAVPSTLPEGAGLNPAIANNIPDYLVRVDLTTGTQTTLAIPEINVSITNPVLSEDGSTLYYVNGQNGFLEKIVLHE